MDLSRNGDYKLVVASRFQALKVWSAPSCMRALIFSRQPSFEQLHQYSGIHGLIISTDLKHDYSVLCDTLNHFINRISKVTVVSWHA